MTSLEYLHSRGYTHNDVKAQNLLLDSSGCDVYLVDFGLASKYKVSFIITFHLTMAMLVGLVGSLPLFVQLRPFYNYFL